MKDDTKWYKTSLGVLALLILFFPAGLYLMWRYTSWHKYLKIGITSIFALFVLAGALGGGNEQSTSIVPTPTTQPSTAKETKPTETPREDNDIIKLNVNIEPTMEGFEITNNETFVIAVCELAINLGILDGGYTYMMGDYLESGKSKVIPYGEFTKKNGTRYNLVETKPKTMKITCQEANSKKGYAVFEAN